jgi:O-antigen ligase
MRKKLSTLGADLGDLPITRVLIVPASLILTVGMLVGGFSLSRLGPSFADVGLLGEVRLIATVSAAFLVALAVQCGQVETISSRGTVKWIMAVCGLHLFTLLTWMWSAKTDFSIQQSYELMLLIAALLVAYHLFSQEPVRALQLIFVAFWGLAIIFCLLGILSSGGLSGDLAAVGAGGIGSARLLGMGVIFSLVLFLRTNSVLHLIPLPVFMMGMMLSGSRASILALGFSVLFLWMCRAKIAASTWVSGRRAFVMFAMFTIVMVTVLVAVPASRAALVAFALSNINVTGGDASSAGIYLADRDTIFLTAWDGFSSNILSGSGIGTYVGPFGELYPHNIALNFAVDGGIVSLVGFFLVVSWPVVRIIRTADAWAIGALSAGLFFLVASFFSGTYYDARFVWVFLLLGLLCSDRCKNVPRSVSVTPQLLRL